MDERRLSRRNKVRPPKERATEVGGLASSRIGDIESTTFQPTRSRVRSLAVMSLVSAKGSNA